MPRHRTLRSILVAILLVLPSHLCVASGSVAASVAAGEPDEYELKAALLYKFAKFVSWPETAFADESAPFELGVLGPDPFGARLDRMLADRTVHGREVVIHRFAQPDEMRTCHVLFVSEPASEQLSAVLEASSGKATLLVGDRPRFAHEGGMINLYRRSSSIRFEINKRAAGDARLTIDAKLLQLARIVRG